MWVSGYSVIRNLKFHCCFRGANGPAAAATTGATRCDTYGAVVINVLVRVTSVYDTIYTRYSIARWFNLEGTPPHAIIADMPMLLFIRSASAILRFHSSCLVFYRL